MHPLPSTFAALADPVRFSMIDRLLEEGELSAGQLREGIDISAPAVSQHLKVLHDAGLVQRRSDAQRRIYSIAPQGFAPIASWVDQARQFWEGSLDRIEQALREDLKSNE